MRRVDHTLIYQACRLATGANAHSLYTCINYYETTKNPKTRARYEGMLRELIASHNRIVARREELECMRSKLATLNERSNLLDEKISLVHSMIKARSRRR